MPERPSPQPSGNRPSKKRVIILGAVLLVVFVLWVVTMLFGTG